MLLILSVSGFVSTNARAQDANDNFAASRVLPGISGTVQNSNVNASKEAGEPNHAGNPGGASLWYRWTAPHSSNVTFSVPGSGFPALLAVYTGNAVNALAGVASNSNPSPSGIPISVTFKAVAGTVYQIAVDSFNFGSGLQSGNFTLDYLLGPVNDDFANARILPGTSGAFPDSNINASQETGEPDHAGNIGGASVWYRWTALYSSNVTFNVLGNGLSSILAVYTGNSVNALTEVASNISLSTSSVPNSVTFAAVAGTVYQIAVDGVNPDIGPETGLFTVDYLQDAPDIAIEQPAGNDVPDNGSRSFGNVLVGNNASLSFIVRNAGSVNLTGLGITIDGPNASEFTVTTSPTSPVTQGNSTTFTVRFSPLAGGIRTAAIHIASNDADEDPFDILLDGTGLAPEIAVQQPQGVDVPINGSRNFGNVPVGSNAPLTFTITNNGNSDLTGLGIFIGGPNASEFAVSTFPTAPVTQGNSTTFTVVFSPSARGIRTATIRIGSNDADENPFDIVLNGTGLAPEIAVQQPPGADVPNNGSRNFGNVPVGSNAPLTFTITNNGNSDLLMPGSLIGGPDASEFIFTGVSSAIVGPGDSISFTVQFVPGSAGVKTATVRIASNDADEDPFDILLNGTGVAPEIAVQQPPGADVPINGSRNFGKVAVGSSAPLTFTIRNNGTSDLVLPGGLIDGPDASEFTITRLPSTTVGPGDSTRITVQFAPATAGAKTAALLIGNNDIDESPFIIFLNGSGMASEIAVKDPAGKNVANGGKRDFGNVAVGRTGEVTTFTIRNDGASTLTGLALTTSGNQASFLVSSISKTTLAPGASATFTATFVPDGTGRRKLVVRIASADADVKPFKMTLTGTGTSPEIALELQGGQAIPGEGLLDFGPAIVCKDKPVRTLTIRNVGTAKLTRLAVSSSSAFFTASPLRVTSLAPGASTTFKVTFCPGYYGKWRGVLSIRSNDKDGNPFEINLIGRGVARLEKSAAASLLAESLGIDPPAALQQKRDLSRIRVTVNPEDGLKYLTLEITKVPGTENASRTVEVSPNLVDWYSGGKHTTVIRDDARILKVRDNTPVTPGRKRHIRLRDSAAMGRN